MNLQYSPYFKIPRKIVRFFLYLAYPIVIRLFPLPKVKSISETITKIVEEKVSICRFGDSEFLYLVDRRNLPYQLQNERLRDYFKKILNSNYENILIGLPVGYYSLTNLNKEAKVFWRAVVSLTYPRLRKYLDLDKQYYNASMTRLYFDYEDKTQSDEWFKKVRSIWSDRNILLIEGEKSRLGVGNNLFENAKSIKRILGPAHNSFDKFDNILEFANMQSKEHLVLIAMGPTAKALVFELALRGFQAIDIGNLDVEYEWFLQGAKEKVKIPGKYTSEAKGGRDVEEIFDNDYNEQIIAHFTNAK